MIWSIIALIFLVTVNVVISIVEDDYEWHKYDSTWHKDDDDGGKL